MTKKNSFSDLDNFKNEILEDLKSSKINDLEDMVFGMEITYDELFNIIHIKYIPLGIIGFTLPPRISEISDLNLM